MERLGKERFGHRGAGEAAEKASAEIATPAMSVKRKGVSVD